MKSRISALLIVLFCVGVSLHTAHAQKATGTLQGEVQDESGNPIAFANLIIEETRLGAYTNENGVFSIRSIPFGDYRLLISSVGYERQTVNVTINQATQRLNFTLKAQEDLSEVVIQSSKIADYKSLNRIDVPAKDLPLTQSSIDRSLMLERNVDELSEALKVTPGIRVQNNYGGFQTFNIRGFNNFVLMVDGVRDERHNISNSAPTTNLANVQSIEVLKGPASVLFGHSALGGVINITRKQPTREFSGELNAAAGSYNTKRLSAGVGGPINDKLRYRLDFGMSDTDGFRGAGFQTNNVYLALDYQPTAFDVIQLKVQVNKDLYDTDTGVPTVGGRLPDGFDVRTRLNDPQDYLGHTRYDYQLRYERTFRNGMVLSNLLSYYDDDIDYFSTEELTLNASLDSVQRTFPFYFNHETKPIQNQVELTQTFNLAGMQLKSLVGHSFSYMDRKTYNGTISGPGRGASTSLINPVLNQGALFITDTRYQARLETVHGIYMQHWLEISPKLKALIGGRYDIFDGLYFTDQVSPNREVTSRGDRVDYNRAAFTYRAGLVYQPTEQLSVFGSYSTYFKPTRTVTLQGEIFDPETGYQGEFGVRYELDDVWSVQVSAFKLVRTNILENLGSGIQRNVGEGQSQGFEAELIANPIKGLNIRTGYTYAVTEIIGFDTDIATNPNAGNRLPNAPQNLFTSWVNYEFSEGPLKGFSIGGGTYHLSEIFNDAANTAVLPAYWVIDTTIGYKFGNSELRLNVNNVADRLYYTSAIYNTQFVVGNDRNFMLSFRHQF